MFYITTKFILQDKDDMLYRVDVSDVAYKRRTGF